MLKALVHAIVVLACPTAVFGACDEKNPICSELVITQVDAILRGFFELDASGGWKIFIGSVVLGISAIGWLLTQKLLEVDKPSGCLWTCNDCVKIVYYLMMDIIVLGLMAHRTKIGGLALFGLLGALACVDVVVMVCRDRVGQKNSKQHSKREEVKLSKDPNQKDDVRHIVSWEPTSIYLDFRENICRVTTVFVAQLLLLLIVGSAAVTRTSEPDAYNYAYWLVGVSVQLACMSISYKQSQVGAAWNFWDWWKIGNSGPEIFLEKEERGLYTARQEAAAVKAEEFATWFFSLFCCDCERCCLENRTPGVKNNLEVEVWKKMPGEKDLVGVKYIEVISYDTCSALKMIARFLCDFTVNGLGRQLLIISTPMFLMVAEDPIDVVKDAVAIAFITTIDTVQVFGQKKPSVYAMVTDADGIPTVFHEDEEVEEVEEDEDLPDEPSYDDQKQKLMG